MRRPVGVSRFFSRFVKHRLSPCRVAAVAMLPSALSRSEFVSLGACLAFSVHRCCHLFGALWLLLRSPASASVARWRSIVPTRVGSTAPFDDADPVRRLQLRPAASDLNEWRNVSITITLRGILLQ